MFGMFAAIGQKVEGEKKERQAAAASAQAQGMGQAQAQTQGLQSQLMSFDYNQIPSYQDFTNFK